MKNKFEQLKNILSEKVGKFNIKFLIIIALAVMIMTGIAIYLLIIRTGGKAETPKVNYDSFEIGREQVDSIGKVVGEERPWSSMEFTVEGTTETSTYSYTGLTTGAEDVKKYAEYLKDTCGFVPMMKFDPSNPAGYLSYGKASIDPGYMLKIDIDYTNEDYKIYTNKSESTDIPTSDPNDDKTVSKEDTLQYLKGYDYKVLGLPKELSEYVIIYDVGRTVINGLYCHGINVYKKSADGKSNLVVGKFYVPVDESSVYKYDVLTDSFTQIKRIVKTPPPPVETLEAAKTPEEPPEIDTSNMTKEEIKAMEKEQKEKAKLEAAAAKEQEKIDKAAQKELDKVNKAAQKEQEKKAAATKKAASAATKAEEKAKKAEEEAAKAEEKAKEAMKKAQEEKRKASEAASKIPPESENGKE